MPAVITAAKKHACASRHGPTDQRGRNGRAPDDGTARIESTIATRQRESPS